MERYVSFETAKMLKDVGFDESCGAHYEFCEGGLQYKYVAPTQALAAKWLREVHRIVLDVTFIPPLTSDGCWQYFIGNMGDMIWSGDFIPSEAKFQTYEEAMEAGLQRAIEMIKNKAI